MLPPKDLGSFLPKLQQMEPAVPLPHHPSPPPWCPLHEGKLPLSAGSGNCSPSFPISGHRDSPLAFQGSPREGFSGLTIGQPWAATGIWALGAERMEQGDDIGAGMWGFQQTASSGEIQAEGNQRRSILTCKKWK